MDYPLLRKRDVIITPTEYSKKLLQSLRHSKADLQSSNGSTRIFSPKCGAPRAFRLKYGLGPEDKAVISVGHYIERKGLPDFIELARRMPQMRFFWFGYTNLNLVPKVSAPQ
jgi:1,2-diacylglycerol-3-alpha-glucose alpha-1,2-glucosyltransferase